MIWNGFFGVAYCAVWCPHPQPLSHRAGSLVIWRHHDHITVLFSQLFHLVTYIQSPYFIRLMPDHFFCQTQVGQNPFMPDAACLIVPVSTAFGPVALPATSPDLPSPPPYSVPPVVLFPRLRLSLRPNPKRGLLSSRKFCSICILRLYSAIIWCGSRPSVTEQQPRPRALLRCSCCVLAFRPFHDALLPGAVRYGTGHRALPRRPVARRPQAR